MSEQVRYRRLKSLYLDARALRGEERARFLEEECGHDPALRGEVEGLLAQDSELMTAIDGPATTPVPGFDRPPPVVPGIRIGPYQIEEPLGQGGMGVIFRALDTRLERRVALKFLAVRDGSSPPAGDAVERFLSEARAASALDHPNLCTVHDFGVWEGHAYLAMAYYPGESLQDRLDRGPLPVAEAVEIAAQVASGLAAAHEAGIVHRDIKPSNVVLSDRGTVKVVDFGLATHPGRERLTRSGLAVGTPGFMSPEQIKGEGATAASDVWALGVTLYEMLAGRPPFRGDSLPATVYSTVHEDPPDLRVARPEVPAWLAGVVARCLQKNPGMRYADARGVHQALARGAGQTGGAKDGSRRRRLGAGLAVACLAAAGFAASVLVPRWQQEGQRRWLHEQALPEIRHLAGEDMARAYRLAREARERVAGDPQLEQLWLDLTVPVTLTSEPAGAEVAIRGYQDGDAEWLPIGRTPLKERLPLTMLRYRVNLDGYELLEAAPSVLPRAEPFVLSRHDEAPEGMVPVPAGTAWVFTTPRPDPMIAELPQFWIGRHEVTNREFRRFVEEGGYLRAELWEHPVEVDGRALPWEEAMALFVDSTGMPGPSTWALGTYPDGEGDYPVEGVSWYEAAAYAELVGKSLPSIYHWARAAFQGPGHNPNFSDVLTVSTFASRRSSPVGAAGSVGPFGTQDLAGNVKEWCANPTGPKRYLLGGAWNETHYRFADLDAQLPTERRLGYGFRLIQQVEPLAPELLADVGPVELQIPEAVDDATFAGLAQRFEYDPTPLEARIDWVDDSHEAWRREAVSFAAAYPGERAGAHVFLPRGASPPYQAVIHFPGGDALMLESSRDAGLLHVEPFLRSGRAVVYPIYKGTFERQVGADLGILARTNLLVQQIQDLRRTVDYLLTRPEIDGERLAFHGLSYGAYRAPFALAIEDRFRAGMVVSTGILHQGQPPEAQQQNYLPRVTLPVLYLTGRDDFTFPFETSQRRFFELLGTPSEHKRHVALDGKAHIFPRSHEAARELLAWVDLWLGPVGGPGASHRAVGLGEGR
jgi:eukaryotic-like serine/threonine-protein kinase